MQTKQFLNNSSRRHLPLSLIAAALIILIAVSALLYLRTLATLYEKASRSSTAKSVIDQGAYISRWLAEYPFFQGTQASPVGDEASPRRAQTEKEAAENFNRAVDWLQKMESAVQYVAISEDDIILYQRQIGAGREKTDEGSAPSRKLQRGRAVVGRRKLVIGTNTLPVITFSMIQTTPDGHKRNLELGLNKIIIDRQSAGAASALSRMFYLSLATIAIAFAVCLAAIIGLIHREMVWQKRSRFNEHLAFAGAVAGSVIHDFRNPLSAMRLDAQLLQSEAVKKNECSPERLAELAQRIVKTIDRIDGLLAEFLTLATPRFQRGKPNLSRQRREEWLAKPEGNARETFDVNACVLDCIELLKVRFENAGVNLAADLTGGHLPVSGFSAQFKRALLNIMTNAEQFSPQTGRVTVQTRAEKKYAFIKITDEGPGVPHPERKKIFGLFYSKRSGGTGIGLALAKTAIENCGGDITLETPRNGKGACFIIKIPLV